MMTREDEHRLEAKMDEVKDQLSSFIIEYRVEAEKNRKSRDGSDRLNALVYDPDKGLIIRLATVEQKCKLLMWASAGLAGTTIGLLLRGLMGAILK